MARRPKRKRQIRRKNKKCKVCGTSFMGSEDARIHIGEVHMEEELALELLTVFPGGIFNCKACGEDCGSEYEKKEHILVNHPWAKLKSLADGEKGEHVEKESEKEKEIEPENVLKRAKGEQNEKEEEAKKDTDIESVKSTDARDEDVAESACLEKWYHGINYFCKYCEINFAEHFLAV